MLKTAFVFIVAAFAIASAAVAQPGPGGPGPVPPPSPWLYAAPSIYAPAGSCITFPQTVPGGCPAGGNAINLSGGYYLNGVALDSISSVTAPLHFSAGVLNLNFDSSLALDGSNKLGIGGGIIGYALIGTGSSSVPTYQGFLQVGTGPVTRPWQSKAADQWNLADFGALCNTTANDTANIETALNNAPPGIVLTIPSNAGLACTISQQDPNPAYSLLISNGIQLVGNGRYANLAPASGMPAATNLIRIVSGGANSIGLTLDNFMLSNLSNANSFTDAIRIDTTATTGNLQAVQISRLLTADGGNSGYGLRVLNNATTNPGGGLTYSTIRDNFALYGGLYFQLVGDSDEVSRNVIAPNASNGSGQVYVSQIAGAGNFRFMSNNVTVNGGIIHDAGSAPIYAFNEIELVANGTEANNCMVDLLGSVRTLDTAQVLFNQIQAIYSLNTNLTTPLCVNAASHVFIEGNRISTSGAYAGLVIGSGATGTVIGAGNVFVNGQTGAYLGQSYADSGVDTRWVVTAGLKNVVDANWVATPFERTVAYITSLTAARTVTLPPANSLGRGELFTIRDDVGLASATLTLSAAPNGSDNIDGANSTLVVVNNPQGVTSLVSDGVSNWFTPNYTFTGDLSGSTVTTRFSLTLNTVNSNVGSCATATQVCQITVNAKGLVTAAANVTINPTQVNGVAFPATPSTNTVPVVTGSNTITYEAVPNAALVNASITVNGATCTLGSSCSPGAGALAVGDSLTGGTPNGVLYNNANTVGNLGTGNNGVLVTSAGGVPSISSTLPSGLSAPSFTVTVAFTATGLVTLADIATQAANTVLVNATSGTASPTAQAVAGCSAAGSALNWTTNTGFGCNSAITAAALSTAYTDYTSSATVTCQSGGTGVSPFAYTMNDAHYMTLGKQVFYTVDISITTLGTVPCAGALIVTVPVTPNSANGGIAGPVFGREYGNSGFSVQGIVNNTAGGQILLYNYAGVIGVTAGSRLIATAIYKSS